MSKARAPLQRIVVAGAGQVGVLAAIAVKRAVPDAQVAVIGIPPDPTAFADHASGALPFTVRLHERLGVSEAALVARAGGSHRLLTRYFGWGGGGSHGAVPYGAPLDPAQRTAFAREWGGGTAQRGGASPATGSIAEVLTDAGRFASGTDGNTDPLAGLEYGMRWNPPAYRDLLIAGARALGIDYVSADIAGARPDGQGGFAALVLEDGSELEADLILDCSGPAARVLSALPDHGRSDWSPHLPVARVMVASPGSPMAALEDRYTLLDQGWLGELAGRDGLRRMLGLASGVSDAAGAEALGCEPQIVLPVAPGCAQRAWIGNVVALGDAAATFDPLSGLNLDLAHRQLDLLLELLPGREIVGGERAEFNRRADLMAHGVRNTLAAHFAAPRAQAIFGARAQPGSVEQTLDQFSRRGRLPFQDEASFLPEERQRLFAALGHPRGIPPQERAVSEGAIEAARRAFAAQAKAALAASPPYTRWLAQVARG